MTAEIGKEVSRGRMLEGMTLKIETGCGNIYITVNHTKGGAIREVFAKIGKVGSCMSAHTDAEGRLSSMYLRSGGNIDKLIKHLQGISCGNSTKDMPSCPTALSIALIEAKKELEAKK